MTVLVMAISNVVLTRQIYSEEANGAHAHYREPVPLKHYFQTNAVSSSWLNQSRDDRKSKTRPRNKASDHQTNQSERLRQN